MDGIGRRSVKAWPVGCLVAALFALLVAAGCGGGGSGATAGPGPEAEATGQAPGRVAVLLTDGPTEDFAHVWVTVTGVELLSDASRVPIFEGEETIDLLDLRAESTLLTLCPDVPAGTYEKIRLTVKDLVLEREVDGQMERIEPKLPGNGKIDLNPRSPFRVGPGETLVVELDLDAAKSLHVVERGKSSEYVFRPVVFVTVRDGELPAAGKLTRLTGRIEAIDAIGGSFLLNPSPDPTVPAGTAPLDPRWVQVFDTPETSYFDGTETPSFAIAFEGLAVGDEVTAVGRFRPPLEGVSAPCELDALLVERGTFLRLSATVLGPPQGVPGIIPLRLDPGQGITGVLEIDAHLFEGTKVVWRSGAPAGIGDIAAARRCRVDALLHRLPAGADGVRPPDVLLVALVVLEPDDDVARYEGALAAVDPAAGTLSLLTAAGQVDMVFRDLHVYLVRDDSVSYQLERGDLTDLALGAALEVYGRWDDLGRFVAQDVFIVPPSL